MQDSKMWVWEWEYIFYSLLRLRKEESNYGVISKLNDSHHYQIAHYKLQEQFNLHYHDEPTYQAVHRHIHTHTLPHIN